MILIIIKFCELLLPISPRIINSLRNYIKHLNECFLLYFLTPRSWLKKTRLRLVFPTYFSMFGNRRKHFSSCLIYYMKSSEVCIKTRSPPASLPIQGQVTKQTTVKWPIGKYRYSKQLPVRVTCDPSRRCQEACGVPGFISNDKNP